MADFTEPSGGFNWSELKRVLQGLQSSVDRTNEQGLRDRQAVARGAEPSRTRAESSVRRYSERGVGEGGAKPGGIKPSEAAKTSRLIGPGVQEAQKERTAANAAATAEKKRAAELEKVRRIENGAAAATQKQNLALQKSVQNVGLASQSYRKHGALTTEFLSAAARGDTTFRELGYQVGATIGKFAGWTAAAGAVFLVMDAVKELGTGALQGSSKVNQLHRVIQNLDFGKAHEQLRSLSGEFNLPTEVAGEAFFQMAKVFGTQDQAFEGARAALAAVKVGELETADATRFLTSIVQAFGPEAVNMGDHLDRVNNLQNRFGIAIRGTEAGVAKAAGTWKAAGGDLNTLTSIIAVGQRVTGRSGEEIGTALSRSSEMIRRSPKRQREVEKYLPGVDAQKTPIGEIYEQAFAAVKTGKIKGPDVTKLATALSSPQQSGKISPILQAFNLYEDVQRGKGSPENSKGSVKRELNVQLDAADERLKKIGVTLQSIGDALAEGGFFTSFSLMLGVLNTSLKAVEGLASAFASLPGPIRQSLAILLEMYGVLRLLRRFNVGQAFIDRAAAKGNESSFGQLTRQRPEKELQRELRASARNEVTYFADRQEGAARNAALRTGDSARLANEREAVKNRGVAAFGGNQEKYNKELEHTSERANKAARLADEATEEYNATQTAHANAVGRQATVNQELAKKGAKAADVAERTGYGYLAQGRTLPATHQATPLTPAAQQASGLFGVPGGKPLTPASQQAAGLFAPVPVTGADNADRAAAKAAASAKAQAAELRRAAARIGRNNAILNTLGSAFGSVGQATEKGRLGRGLDKVGAATPTTGAELRKTATNIYRNNRALGVVGGTLKGIASASQALAGAAVGAGQKAGQSAKSLNAMLGPLDKLFIGITAAYFAGNALKDYYDGKAAEFDRLGKGPPPKEAIGEGLSVEKKLKDSRAGFDNYKKDHPYQYGPTAPFGAPARPPERKDLGEADQIRLKNLDIERNIQRDQQDAVRANKPVPKRFLGEIGNDISKTTKDVQSGRISRAQAIRDLARLDHEIDLARDRDPAHAKDVKSARGSIRGARAALGLGKDRSREGFYLHAQTKDFEKALDDNAKEITLFGYSQRRLEEPVHAYDAALRRYNRTGSHASLEKLQKARDALDAIVTQVNSDLDDALKLSVNQGQRDKAYRQAGHRLQGVHGKVGEKARRELALKQAEEFDAELSSRTDLGQTTTRNVDEQLRKKLRAATFRRLSTAVTYGRDSNESRAAQKEYNEVKREQEDRQLSLLEARTQLGVSQLQVKSPRGALVKALSGARAALAVARRQHRDQEDILKYQNSVQDALNAVVEFDQNQAKETQAALFELRRARTEDPVALAGVDIDEARYNRKVAKTPGERISAQAQEVKARRTRQEAIAQEKIDDVSFKADIGKLTLQSQITAYEKVLKMVKLSKEQRRDLMRRIHSLKKELEGEGNEEISIGSVRLPTVYDIRRAFAGGGAGGSRQVVNMTNAPRVVVNVAETADASKVAAAIDDSAGTSLAAAYRASGYGRVP